MDDPYNERLGKSPLRSQTIGGLVVVIVSAAVQAAALFGLVDEEQQRQLLEILGLVGTVVGTGVSLHGRSKADRPIEWRL
jgi:hypothetical protein